MPRQMENLQDAAPCGHCRQSTVDAAEMKRLCVRDAYRRLGLGRQLADAVLDAARVVGYRCVLLDTLANMQTARALYENPGFQEIPSHHHNLIAGTYA